MPLKRPGRIATSALLRLAFIISFFFLSLCQFLPIVSAGEVAEDDDHDHQVEVEVEVVDEGVKHWDHRKGLQEMPDDVLLEALYDYIQREDPSLLPAHRHGEGDSKKENKIDMSSDEVLVVSSEILRRYMVLVKSVGELKNLSLDDEEFVEKKGHRDLELASTRLKETRLQLEATTEELAQANIKLTRSLDDLAEFKLDLSACKQHSSDLEVALQNAKEGESTAKNLQLKAVKDIEDLKSDAKLSLQELREVCDEKIRSFSCDVRRCTSTLFGKESIATLRVYLHSLYETTNKWYEAASKRLEQLMETEAVQRYIEYFEFVEGKMHIFLYFAWKNTPSIVVKGIREIHLLGYFACWKTEQAVSWLSLAIQKGCRDLGFRLDASVVDIAIWFLLVCFGILVLFRLRKIIWSCVCWIVRTLWFLVCLPFWIITKPFRMLF